MSISFGTVSGITRGKIDFTGAAELGKTYAAAVRSGGHLCSHKVGDGLRMTATQERWVTEIPDEGV